MVRTSVLDETPQPLINTPLTKRKRINPINVVTNVYEKLITSVPMMDSKKIFLVPNRGMTTPHIGSKMMRPTPIADEVMPRSTMENCKSRRKMGRIGLMMLPASENTS
jgi:hypothetical protein